MRDKKTNYQPKTKNRSAFRIFVIYLTIGSLWILFSDMFLAMIVRDHSLHYKLQTPKGWFFILVTGIILYFLIKRDNKLTDNLLKEEKQSRILAEETKLRLEESEKKYRTLIEQAADGIFTTDMEGNFTDANENGCKIFGYSKEELLKLNLKDIADPQDLENNPLRFEQLRAGEITKVNRIIRRKDGTPINVEVNAKMLSESLIQAIVRDVTERKIAEEILAESEKRYRSLFTSNPNPMWVYDLETLKFLDVNEAAVFNYGYSRDEFLSMTIKDIRPQEEIVRLLNNIKTASYGLEYSTGWKHIKKDGSIIYVEVRSNGINFRGRKAKLVSAIDITWRKKAEDELKASTEKLKAFFNSNLIGILFGDIYGNVFEANDEFLRIIGYSRGELEKGLIKWDKITPPEFLPLDRKGIKEALEKGICTPYEKQYIRKDGSLIWVLVGYILLGPKRENSVAYILDLTKLKEAESKQNELREQKDALLKMIQLQIEKMPVGYIVTDENFNFKFLNPAAEKIFGFNRYEVIGKNPYGLIIPETAKEFVEARRKEWLSGSMSAHGINENITKDGRIIICEWINSPIFDEKGNFTELLSMVQDITDRINSEQEIKKSRQELRELASHLQRIREEERAAVSRELHDELGQILTSIKMNLVLIGKELVHYLNNEKSEYFINEIESMSLLLDRSVKSVRKIITQLRPEVLENLDLYNAIEWQIKEFNSKAKIKCTFSSNCTDTSFGMEFNTAIFRIVQEALTNVARHSDATKVDVKLNCSNDELVLSVKDNGKGMENIKQIDKKSFGLLGIRERAILLGGNSEIISAPGEGLELKISIPLINLV